MSKRVCPQRPKTAESHPHPLTNERNLSKSQIMSKRGCLTTAKTTRPNNPRTPYAHERTKAGEIASREQKGVPAAAKNSGITPPSAHERAKLTRIASRERKRVSYGHQNRPAAPLKRRRRTPICSRLDYNLPESQVVSKKGIHRGRKRRKYAPFRSQTREIQRNRNS